MNSSETYSEEKLADLVRFVSRDVRRFLVNFDSSIEYEQDAERFLNCHPSWVSSEDDLNDFGKAMRGYLLAHPEMVERA